MSEYVLSLLFFFFLIYVFYFFFFIVVMISSPYPTPVGNFDRRYKGKHHWHSTLYFFFLSLYHLRCFFSCVWTCSVGKRRRLSFVFVFCEVSVCY